MRKDVYVLGKIECIIAWMMKNYFLDQFSMGVIRRYRVKLCRLALFSNLLLIIVVFLYMNVDNRSISTSYETRALHRINNQLKNHAQFFHSSSFPCNHTENVTSEQQQHYHRISQILTRLAGQTTLSSDHSHLHSRGIVLVLDSTQLHQCHVHLHMIEYTETRLPVQVKSHTTMIRSYFLILVVMVFINGSSRSNNQTITWRSA